MKTLVILGHPDINKSVLNKAFLEKTKENEDILVRDLYSIYPDWNIDKEAEQKLLLEADRIVFQFPFYWYSMPAMLKKWFDEVYEFNFAFGPKGDKLKGKEFIVSVTIGGPEHSYQAGGYNSFSINEFMKPLQQTANLSQMAFREIYKVHDAVRIATSEDYNLIDKLANEYYAHITNPLLDPELKRKAMNDSIGENSSLEK